MTDIADTELAQRLDSAVADYQRRYGREQTMARLEHMLERSRKAQRILDDAKAGAGEPLPRAAE